MPVLQSGKKIDLFIFIYNLFYSYVHKFWLCFASEQNRKMA